MCGCQSEYIFNTWLSTQLLVIYSSKYAKAIGGERLAVTAAQVTEFNQ